jgi:hypothetical protein
MVRFMLRLEIVSKKRAKLNSVFEKRTDLLLNSSFACILHAGMIRKIQRRWRW